MTDDRRLLEVDGLTKEFDVRRSAIERVRRTETERHRAVDDVSFELRRGEILGLAGGSGSGKTTVARCLIRLAEPDSGAIRVDGDDVLAAAVASCASCGGGCRWSSRTPMPRSTRG